MLCSRSALEHSLAALPRGRAAGRMRRERMQTIVKSACVAALLLSLGACSKLGMGGQDEMAWARTALERNSRLEIVASDNQAKTFTVRVKDSGQLLVLSVDQVIAGPAAAM